MNEAKFYQWQNKLKGQLPPKSGFVPMVFANGKQFPSNRVSNNQEAIWCEISYPNGVSAKPTEEESH
jgi:hypothetical protein